MAKSEIELIERCLERAAIQKQWQYGRAIAESLGGRVHEMQKKYLVRHVTTLAEDEPAFLRDHAGLDNVRRRLEEVLPNWSWRGMEPLALGKMNFCINKHYMYQNGNESERVVLEKVFHWKNKGGFQRETKLMEMQGHESLGSPAFYGKSVCEPFLFQYYQFVNGRAPGNEDFRHLYGPRALRHLLRNRVSEELATSVNLHKMLIGDIQVEGAVGWIREKGRASSIEESAVRSAYEIYKESPLTIVHEDLHPGNIIVSDEGFKVIDWDKWRIDRCGAGLNLRGGLKLDRIDQLLPSLHPGEATISLRSFGSNCLFGVLIAACQNNEWSRFTSAIESLVNWQRSHPGL